MDQALQVFIDESQELLSEMEAGLLKCESNDGSPDTINSIFRAAHTIKGSSGLFGLDSIVSFVHVVETALDRVRVGKVSMSAEFAVLLLSCKDHIEALTAAAVRGHEGRDPLLGARSAELSMLLQVKAGAVDSAGAATMPTSGISRAAAHAEQCSSSGHWHISARFKQDVLRGGMDPLSFIRYLTTFGDIKGSLVVADALPSADEFDPESCYLGFEVAFETDADGARIRAAFDFVSEDCVLNVVPPHAPIVQYLELMPEFSVDRNRAAEILVSCGSLTRAEVDSVADEPLPKAADIAAIASNSTEVAKRTSASDSGASRSTAERVASDHRSVRVDAGKLEHLINLVGELIIATAGANLDARRIRSVELQESTARLSDLVEAVRDSALQLRMVKIGATFNRFQRVVNDVARELGKDIKLQLSGEDTELDKTVVEKIGDPLMHLVRNAIDHGIESAATRAASGKPSSGTIKLNAYHESGSIVIEVSDDGGGLKRDKILAKAVERGLIEIGETLTDKEVFGLIFEPGFSTADQITNLSGRGVGMDVVKRNITALRGDVDIHSIEGRGTTVMVRLPLTLAIINGFQVGVGNAVFVLPMDMVEECIEFACETGHDYANVRGEVLPFVRLRDTFGLHGGTGPRESIVVVKHAGFKAGLVVDVLLGECQTVIKPMAKMFHEVKCVSGSSILGNGEVALILDVASLMQQILRDSQRMAATKTLRRAATAASIHLRENS